MSKDERTEETNYKVVVNEAGLYSIWPADRENAFGWQDTGKTGTAHEAFAHLTQVLTDTPSSRSLQAVEAGNALRGDRKDTTIYKVVVNHEEQYSIWPADRENALGWNDAGKSGTKQECLDYIREVWTDMRPLSLRKKW
jgi:MbtH protein